VGRSGSWRSGGPPPVTGCRARVAPVDRPPNRPRRRRTPLPPARRESRERRVQPSLSLPAVSASAQPARMGSSGLYVRGHNSATAMFVSERIADLPQHLFAATPWKAPSCAAPSRSRHGSWCGHTVRDELTVKPQRGRADKRRRPASTLRRRAPHYRSAASRPRSISNCPSRTAWPATATTSGRSSPAQPQAFPARAAAAGRRAGLRDLPQASGRQAARTDPGQLCPVPCPDRLEAADLRAREVLRVPDRPGCRRSGRPCRTPPPGSNSSSAIGRSSSSRPRTPPWSLVDWARCAWSAVPRWPSTRRSAPRAPCARFTIDAPAGSAAKARKRRWAERVLSM